MDPWWKTWWPKWWNSDTAGQTVSEPISDATPSEESPDPQCKVCGAKVLPRRTLCDKHRSEAHKTNGRAGGKRRAEKHTHEEIANWSAEGGSTRWAGVPQKDRVKAARTAAKASWAWDAVNTNEWVAAPSIVPLAEVLTPQMEQWISEYLSHDKVTFTLTFTSRSVPEDALSGWSHPMLVFKGLRKGNEILAEPTSVRLDEAPNRGVKHRLGKGRYATTCPNFAANYATMEDALPLPHVILALVEVKDAKFRETGSASTPSVSFASIALNTMVRGTEINVHTARTLIIADLYIHISSGTLREVRHSKYSGARGAFFPLWEGAPKWLL